MAVIDANRNRYVAPPVTEEVNVFPTTVLPTRLRRISWGAVLAGTVIALMTMFAFNMLGLSIGAATINPVTEANPVSPSLDTTAMVWVAASNLISLFLGGLVAARMYGMGDQLDGVLHGLVTWGTTTLITILVLTTSVGNIVNGLTNAASQALTTAGQAISDVSPEVAQALNLQDNALQGIQNEFNNLMVPAAPVTEANANSTENQPINSATTDTNNMTLEQVQVNAAIRDFLNIGEETTDSDRDNLATMLAENSTLSQQEARATVDRWEQAYTQFRQDAEETVRRVSGQLADAVTVFAGAVFAAMVAGAFAAGAGGAVGTEVLKNELEAAAKEA